MTPAELLKLQIRHVLQKQCLEAAKRLADGPLKQMEHTLVFFDFGEGGDVAFATTLEKHDLLDTWSRLLRGWDGDQTRTPGPLNEAQLRECIPVVNAPAGIGFALLCGIGAATSYIASCHREGMEATIREELLPNWERL